MARRLVSRREAVAFLYRILANTKLSEQDEQIAWDMIHCIEAEKENYHVWDADTSEAVVLLFPKNSKQIQCMDREEFMSICLKYRFLPSASDKEEAQKEVQRIRECFNNLLVINDIETVDDTDTENTETD